jgi:hypothetical protein
MELSGAAPIPLGGPAKATFKPRYGINMLKHLVKKGGKEGTELKLEDLDEDVLRSRFVLF